MTIEAYFKKCIEIWNDPNVKYTPTLKKEMREILNRFHADITFYHEIPDKEIPYLKEQFKKIDEYLSQ